MSSRPSPYGPTSADCQYAERSFAFLTSVRESSNRELKNRSKRRQRRPRGAACPRESLLGSFEYVVSPFHKGQRPARPPSSSCWPFARLFKSISYLKTLGAILYRAGRKGRSGVQTQSDPDRRKGDRREQERRELARRRNAEGRRNGFAGARFLSGKSRS